jgi:peptide/nickel transport system permease protein
MSSVRSVTQTIARRVAGGLPLILAVVVLTFILIRLSPTDPAILMAGDAPSEEFLKQVRERYQLDKPIGVQLLSFIGAAMKGDFGTSVYFQEPVFDIILSHFPVTLLLTVSSLIIASGLGVLLGVVAAANKGGKIDTAATLATLAGYSMPTFWMGQLLIIAFSVHLGWLPSNGMTSTREDYQGWALVLDYMRHMALPVLSLVLFEVAMIGRFTRAAMVQALNQDFITTAYAKGAGRQRVLWRHALPNALVTTITVIGLEFGFLLAGSVVIEIAFGWPGLGRLFFDAIFRRDFPLLTGCFIFTSTIVIVVNMVTDVLIGFIDPRTQR